MAGTDRATLETDDELAARARGGDESAFGVLWNRYHGAAVLCAKSIGRANNTDDIVNDAFLKVWLALKAGNGPTKNFRGYLLAAVRSVSVDYSRAAGHTETSELADATSGESEVDNEVLNKLDGERVNRVFFAMDERLRMVLWLFEVEGLPPREIAERMGLSVPNVWKLSERARGQFAKLWYQSHIPSRDDNTEHAWALSRAGEYLAKQSSPRHLARIEKHLAECADCANAVADGRRTSHLFVSVLVAATTSMAASVILASSGCRLRLCPPSSWCRWLASPWSSPMSR